MNITQNILEIHDRIININKKAELVAATKTRSIDDIKIALGTGKVSSAGENRVQEMLTKYDENLTWDFIGQLQTNKVKYIIGKVRMIHSLDRLALAETIDKESKKRNLKQDVLIEVNTGKEDNKGGIYLESIEEFIDSTAKFENIRIRGIMAVAPIYYSEDELQRAFEKVYAKYNQLRNQTFNYLSMGMSNDYLIAVKAGANLVRLGRAIFGERGV